MFVATFLAAVIAAFPGPSPAAQPENTPSPCPSDAPPAFGDRQAAAASPCPESRKRIGRVSVGRKVNLVGSARSASTGSIGPDQIADRPLLRPGEVLEDIPGLVISQHSGGGKANQYYLRGFQLDHGTNLAAAIDGVPLNLGTHAHGQGYSDVNYLIPELVGYVEFKKGTYFADQGDFAVAGGYRLSYRNTLAPIASFTIGDFGYDRFLAAGSRAAGLGNLLYALEIAHDNGSYVKPDEYHRYNGVLRYSLDRGADAFALTGIAYNGAFSSTDQIPLRAVEAGDVGRFGYEDPSDGGNTYRYALSASLAHADPNGVTNVSAYGVDSVLDLFSNFTYYQNDATDYYDVTQNPVTCNRAYVSCFPNAGTPEAPRTNEYQSYCPANTTAPAGATAHSVPLTPFRFACGDQREQVDKRVYYGFDASRNFDTPGTRTTIGAGLRNDNAPVVGLFLTNDRQQYARGTLSNDRVVLTSAYAYVDSNLRIGSKVQITPGLRFDRYGYRVNAFDPRNSGTAAQTMVNPKFALAYAASRHQEFYADYGASFHSNDARGVIGADDPQTHAGFDTTGTPLQFNAPLTRASGYELGYRYSSSQLTTTISAFRLFVANELIFSGDDGTTAVGGPDVRQGIEFANFFTPVKSWTFDADFATTTARFLTDPLHQGTGVPESLAGVISAGATLDRPHLAASLRLRYFGPRILDTQGDAASPSSLTFNAQATAKLGHRRAISLDIFNILNSRSDDVTYYYGSWLKSDAAKRNVAGDASVNPALGGSGVNDFHLHPSQARTVRLTYSTGL